MKKVMDHNANKLCERCAARFVMNHMRIRQNGSPPHHRDDGGQMESFAAEDAGEERHGPRIFELGQRTAQTRQDTIWVYGKYNRRHIRLQAPEQRWAQPGGETRAGSRRACWCGRAVASSRSCVHHRGWS